MRKYFLLIIATTLVSCSTPFANKRKYSYLWKDQGLKRSPAKNLNTGKKTGPSKSKSTVQAY